MAFKTSYSIELNEFDKTASEGIIKAVMIAKTLQHNVCVKIKNIDYTNDLKCKDICICAHPDSNPLDLEKIYDLMFEKNKDILLSSI
jgi:hypothetical protein